MPKPTTRKPPSGVRTAAALLRALLSLAVLLALLGGLPVLLWWATSVVGPPGIAALSSLFTTDDSGQVFLLALAAAGWAGWALFAVSVLLEIPAQLRGRSAPQIRGLVGQRAAAALVGAVLLALPAGTALAAAPSPAQAATHTTAAAAAAVPGTDSTRTVAAADTGQAAAATHTVRDAKPAESLWSIAEARLGDGGRWSDIAALNEGHTMADGMTFHADGPIQPGWILQLPADARPAPAAGSAPQQSGTITPTTYTVKSGDSLASIADSQLSDADRYGEIFDLNKSATFTDPDLIHPGQQLTLPGKIADNPAPPQEAKPDPGSDSSSNTPLPAAKPAPSTPVPSASATKPAPAPSASATKPAPSATATAKPSASATASPSAPAEASQPAPSAPALPADETPGSRVNFALIAGIGTLLAASLAGALGVRRILQQRERRAGQTIAQDEQPTDLEQLLTATSEPAGIELLDRVLRTLAHHAATDSRDLPALRGARLDTAQVTLLLDEPAEPGAPFTAGPTARTWTLDPAAELFTTEQLADVQAPYPGLVTLGADADGLLLIDLMTCRVLLLDGSDEEVLEVARAVALELGTCAWTDYSEILTTGLGARLAGLLPQGRIRTMPHLPAVAADLGELMLEAHQSGEQVLPWLAVGAGDMDEEHLVQLADALAAGRTLDTGVVLPATEAARRCFPHAEVLAVAHGQDATVGVLETSVGLQRISDEQYRQYVHALKVSTQDPQTAAGPWAGAEDHGQAAAGGAPLTVRATGDDSLDPGNPFPALLAGSARRIPTPTEDPSETKGITEAGAAHDSGTESEGATVTGQTVDTIPAIITPDPAPVSAQLPRQTAAGAGAGTEVRIEVLGPLRITGSDSTAHSPRTTAIAALIHLRPGRSADALCQAMDPATPWSTRTLHSRLSELRSAVGLHIDGQPLLPRPKAGAGYAFHPAVTSDWQQFQALASRGLAAGPHAGTEDLEAAMALVRGKPFDGRMLPWADPVIQDMLSRITDTAHTLARWQTDGALPDLDAARHTVHKGLEFEETSEVLYRDLLTIEWAAGNDAAIRRTVARIQQMARTYDITLEDATEDTITLVLSGKPTRSGAHTVKV
ncbi:LysM peptidoglycan-binding domain-containing protein [Streptomyces sp. NBC_01565]|uniref:LysM peptidoglycan-binding domain-containing protein n=1 Tax=unclassified Streptomyces TaxID=2593676 RepID=UPI00224F605B|nr:LysM peptidoglycan-binding domain-containing protein [Streptomyces sp. NBC_01565]MCX4546914.1 LysM peptidoglycan-binding domain-containing protein [Streptomyces sp. NBC_01565]